MSFKDGDLVWAKIKGYPYWPAKVLAKSKAPPKVLKSEHRSSDLLVRFFGKPVTYGWMLARELQHFHGSKADTKSTSKKLSYAIDEAIKHERRVKQGLTVSDSSDSSSDSSDSSSDSEESQSRSEEIKIKKRARGAKSRDEKKNGKIEDKARDQRMVKREQARQQSRATESSKKARGRPSKDTPVKSVKTESAKEVKTNDKISKKQDKKSASAKNARKDKENHKGEHDQTSATDKNTSNDKSASPVRREEKKKPIYRMEESTPANDVKSPANKTNAAANDVKTPANGTKTPVNDIKTPANNTTKSSATDTNTPPKKRKRDSDSEESPASVKRRKLSPSGEGKSGEGKSGELTLDKLIAYKSSLRATLKEQREAAAVRLLHKLKTCHVTIDLLQKSKIGKTVKEYQQHPNKEVAQLCTEIFDSYLKLYKAEVGDKILNGSHEPSSSEYRT